MNHEWKQRYFINRDDFQSGAPCTSFYFSEQETFLHEIFYFSAYSCKIYQGTFQHGEPRIDQAIFFARANMLKWVLELKSEEEATKLLHEFY